MTDTVEFDVRIDADLDPVRIEELLRRELECNPGLRVVSCNHAEPLGMMASEIAISFIVSLVSSSLVHVYRNHIDAAAQKVGEMTQSAIRVIFRRDGD
jgi:hypothetical protein